MNSARLLRICRATIWRARLPVAKGRAAEGFGHVAQLRKQREQFFRSFAQPRDRLFPRIERFRLGTIRGQDFMAFEQQMDIGDRRIARGGTDAGKVGQLAGRDQQFLRAIHALRDG